MRIYFDISDVVKYAVGNSSVSGIQRVQMRVLSELQKNPKREFDLRICFWDAGQRQYWQVQDLEFLSNVAFDSEELLGKLGLIRGGFWPEKFRVKRFLKQYESNKLRRAFEKLKIYGRSLFCRGWLRKAGVLSDWRGVPALKSPLADLEPADAFVMLGAFWDYEEVMQKAEKHKAQGGHTVVLVHDLIPLVAKDYSTKGLTKIFESVVPRLAGLATKILAVSNSTAADLYQTLGNVVSNITVTPLAHEFAGFQRRSGSGQGGGNYVLCVGTLEIRKNGILLLRLWERLIKKGITNLPDLIFAGKYGWHLSDFKKYLSDSPLLAQKVVIVNAPDDQQLARLYSDAKFCVFPSFYEGWGLPVGEAAWFGQFVIASSRSSIPEVCGEAMCYADPDDIEAWEALVLEAIEEPKQLMKRREMVAQLNLRSWADVAESMREAIRSSRP